jgi:hypothetical protein
MGVAEVKSDIPTDDDIEKDPDSYDWVSDVDHGLAHAVWSDFGCDWGFCGVEMTCSTKADAASKQRCTACVEIITGVTGPLAW